MQPRPPGPGWYDDPNDPAAIRWWDGLRWSDLSRRPKLSEDWRAWISRSRRARTISRVLIPLDALAALVALATVLSDVFRQRPTLNLIGLLVIGGPLLAAGQLWLIALMESRFPRRPRGLVARFRERSGRSVDLLSHPIQVMFGGLPWPYLTPTAGLALTGWLAAMTAFPDLGHGGPGSSDSCRYPLDNHGVITCVTRAAYDRAGAAEQRFAAGILLAFFCLHLAAALGHLIGRRRTL